jgi:hypothetical protein
VNGTDVSFAALTLAQWIVPTPIRSPWELAPALLLTGALALLALDTARLLRLRTERRRLGPDGIHVLFPLLLYILGYGAFVVLAKSVVDAQIDLGARMLSLIIPPAVVLAATALHWAWRQIPLRPALRLVFVALPAALLTTVAAWITYSRAEGLGFNSPGWRSSALIEEVRALPSSHVIYSNIPAAISSLTSREAAGLPRRAFPATLAPNRRYDEQLQQMCATARSQPVVIAFFTEQDAEWFVPSMPAIRARLQSHPARVVSDGVLDTVPTRCARVPTGTLPLTVAK